MAGIPASEFEQARWNAFLPLHAVLMGAVALTGLAVLWLRLYEPDASQDAFALGCGIGAAALMVYARYGLGARWSSASMVYLALFWMFHYGLATTSVLVPSVLNPFPAWQIAWLYWPTTRAAMALGLLGAAGFVGGLGLATLIGRTAGQHPPAAALSHDSAMYGVGWVVMLAGLGASLAILVANGGFRVLALSYGDFRMTVLGPTGFQSAMDASQLGGLLALCGAGDRRWMLPLGVWAAFGGLLLLLGLRNEALIPLVSFAIVLSHRGVRFRRGVLVAAALATLVMIPAIKAFRAVGFSNRAAVDWTDASPLGTLVELGGTLRATKAYVDRIDDGDSYLLGASYWAPIDRQVFDRIIPGREPIPAAKDPRIPARDIASREGSVGASSTGEAYYNFGTLGPLIFYGVLGVMFGWLERQAPVSPYWCALLGVAMSIFYFNIRDAWLPVPSQATLALAALGLCTAIAWLRDRRQEAACF